MPEPVAVVAQVVAVEMVARVSNAAFSANIFGMEGGWFDEVGVDLAMQQQAAAAAAVGSAGDQDQTAGEFNFEPSRHYISTRIKAAMQLQDNATGQAGGANIAGGGKEAKDLDVVEEEVEAKWAR